MTEPSRESDYSDEKLMTGIARGDHGAFRILVERHQALVIGTIARMVGTSDAEDIAQHVFLNVWKSASRWRPEAKLTTWLMTITKRLAFNESRRKARARIRSRDPDDDSLMDEHPDDSPGPDRRMLDGELHSAVEEAMLALNEKERMAVVLRRYEGMPYEEIAEILGVTVPALKSLLFRARSTLREKLSPYLEGKR